MLAKRILVVFAVTLLAVIYAIPNLYPDEPTIIFQEAVEHDQISATLANQGFDHSWSSEHHLQLTDVDSQIKARDLLKELYPEYSLSINLESSTPKWLKSLGASPMKLGLDLQGGIHFLLEVDTSHIETTQGANKLQQIKDLLKNERIRYTSVQSTDNGYHIELLQDTMIDTASAILTNRLPNSSIAIQNGTLVIQEPGNQDAIGYAVSQTINSLEKRINELGISEATIQKQGDKHISIDLPGIQDIVYAKKIIGKTATLRFQMVEDPSSESTYLSDQSGHQLALNPKVILSGDAIAFAHAKLTDGSPVVEIQLDGTAETFYKTTASQVGKRLAVIYSEIKDDTKIEKIISAPVIRQALGDNFVIQGSSSYLEAKELALLLRSGALAAPVKFIEETTIGPSLGADNIAKGITSLLAGTGIIFLFMAYYYRVFGMIANAALLLNVVMIVSILSLMGATLTLPGIAGIVLSVGMAVDANVLINERIREETHANAPLKTAISLGYEKALSAIIDANITTLLVTLVLFGLGSGAVKGFAITTCMGILASVFSSVYFTHALTDWLIDKKLITEVNLSHDWFANVPRIDFMRLSRHAFIFSGLILVSCVAALSFNNINLGLDFTGGQQLTLQTVADTHSEDVRGALQAIDLPQAQVQTYGSSETFLIKIGELNQSGSEIQEALEAQLPGSKVLQSEYIGPQVGMSMLKSSLTSVLAALAVTMCYVAIRFEYRFSMSAIVSLIHDPILILGIFALTQIEFNLIALAAMLTILGYSINDTIVVYDRVRENFITSMNLQTEEVINDAINQTLSRTVLTSCLTLIVVMALYIFGGDYLHGFSLSLAIGIIIGTYSSIYIAGSMAVKLGLKRDDLLPPQDTGEIYEP